MNTLRSFLLFSILMVSGYSIVAQPGQGRRFDERIRDLESRRVAHITNALSLSPTEATMFWPVYNEYLKKVNDLNEEQRKWHQRMASARILSESEAALIAENEVERMEKAASLRRTYHEKLKDILPVIKIAQLYEAEREFNRMLFRETQQRFRE